jgi:hypothetical protein
MTGDGSGIIRFGVHKPLEDVANEMIRKSLEGVTSMAEKSDILTPWKEQDRRNREVYNAIGVPDPSTRKGLYHRVRNAGYDHLNSRDGIVRGHRTQSLSDFVRDNASDASVEMPWTDG